MRLISHKVKKNRVKEKLKKATLEVLAEKGYASVSTRDIVKRANTALGQLTYYYKTKDSLIIEVIDEEIEKIIAEFNNVVTNSEDKRKAMRDFLADFLSRDDTSIRIFIDLITQSLYNNSLSIMSSNMINRISEIIVQVLMSDSEISKKDAEVEAQQYINYLLGVLIRKNIKFNTDYDSTIKNKKNKSKKVTVNPVYN